MCPVPCEQIHWGLSTLQAQRLLREATGRYSAPPRPTPRSRPCTPHMPLLAGSPAIRFPRSAAWRARWRHGCCPAAAASRAKTHAGTVSGKVRRWLHLPRGWQRPVRLCCHHLHATLAVGCLTVLSQGTPGLARPWARCHCLRTQLDKAIGRTGMGCAFVSKQDTTADLARMGRREVATVGRSGPMGGEGPWGVRQALASLMVARGVCYLGEKTMIQSRQAPAKRRHSLRAAPGCAAARCVRSWALVQVPIEKGRKNWQCDS